ncbi:MAG: helix-turn-helix transcriptional regulator [Anaerotignum sp.]|nr:helix-turn-helix transcriptional regulator [Anaerotignum sp.]MDY3927344.1 helix-turn-helix transcriptional regulator [Anaerotignum sp.]
MSLNQRIKEARLKMGYTQEQLGNMIGVAKTTVAGYEKNREPDAATIGLIIDALKVDANFLFQDEMKELSAKDFTIPEIKMIKKYRSLDDHGKEMVDLVLAKEYDRTIKESKKFEMPLHLMPVAAHNDNQSEEQERLMREDLDEL